jgi:hypothetical protein
MKVSDSDEDDSNVVVISMGDFQSDGDVNTWPALPYKPRDDSRWRQLLAENWLKSQGSYVEGKLSRRFALPNAVCDMST